MTTKAYLQQIYWLQVKIKHKVEELNTLRAGASGFKGLDYSADKVQATPGDHMAESVGRFVDLEQEINAMIADYFRRKDTIINQIHTLSDVRYVEILYKRYVEFKTFGRIAKEMHYEYKYISKLQRRALQTFGKTILK